MAPSNSTTSASATAKTTVRAAPPKAPTVAAKPPEPPSILLVEYLNAFCGHCRATHERLDRILADRGIRTRRRHVYVWASSQPPLWAQALAATQVALGRDKEEAFFAALLHARSENADSIWGAAREVGIDPAVVMPKMGSPQAADLLSRHRSLMEQGRIRGIPTLDLGCRRLQGEQSDGELEEAVEAALACEPASRIR
jgi:protein-disulfide isomerase